MSVPAPAVSETALLARACREAGVPVEGAKLLRRHANATYLLPEAGLVLRLGATRPAAVDKAARGVQVARWLAGLGFPTIEPADLDQPLVLDDGITTFWRYYPQPDRGYPPPSHLGTLLCHLHQVGTPPVALPTYRPLTHFNEIVASAQGLADDDRAFLTDRSQTLLQAYEELDFVLSPGLIHGDAARSNTLWDGERVVLADWDAVCLGPREQDLTLTHQNARLGLPASDRQSFADRYGYDVTTWEGYPVLRDIQELHTLTSFLRLAPHDAAAAGQLSLRITCLRHGDLTTRWTAF